MFWNQKDTLAFYFTNESNSYSPIFILGLVSHPENYKLIVVFPVMIGIKLAVMEQNLINVIPVNLFKACELFVSLLTFRSHIKIYLQSVVLIHFILNGEAIYHDYITVRVDVTLYVVSS